MKTLIGSFSSGVSSFLAAVRMKEIYGSKGMRLLFADMLTEEPDNYRFLIESAAFIFDVPKIKVLALLVLAEQVPVLEDHSRLQQRKNMLAYLAVESSKLMPRLHWISGGRTQWEIAFDERFLPTGNKMICTRIGKGELMDAWRERQWRKGLFTPKDTILFNGIEWSESHRYTEKKHLFLPWKLEAPMCDAPYLQKGTMLNKCLEIGVRYPRMYDEGFTHGNCSRMCFRAGQAHWALVFQKNPELYRYAESQEQRLQTIVSEKYSILRDRRNKQDQPMSLKQFRHRLECGESYDLFEVGGCGCTA